MSKDGEPRDERQRKSTDKEVGGEENPTLCISLSLRKLRGRGDSVRIRQF